MIDLNEFLSIFRVNWGNPNITVQIRANRGVCACVRGDG